MTLYSRPQVEHGMKIRITEILRETVAEFEEVTAALGAKYGKLGEPA